MPHKSWTVKNYEKETVSNAYKVCNNAVWIECNQMQTV